MPFFQLSDDVVFPPAEESLEDGLLAIGGDLSPQRLIEAYSNGIFPWYSEEAPDILWWSPDPRMMLFPNEFKCSKSLGQKIRRKVFEIRIDTAFEDVIEACSKVPRPDQEGTWIFSEMKEAYIRLHQLQLAHTVECWQEGKLVGGLYGLSLGRYFFGESMFHLVSDASKVAFYYLSQLCEKLNFEAIDCQMHTNHLESLGARTISRSVYLDNIRKNQLAPTLQCSWSKFINKL